MDSKALSRLIVGTLKKFPHVQFAILYGSYAKGTDRTDSDLDLAVAGRDRLSLQVRSDLSAALSAATGKEVDLIDLNEVTGVILGEALCEGKILLLKDKDLYAGLIKKYYFDQADFQPYYDRILEARRKRFTDEKAGPPRKTRSTSTVRRTNRVKKPLHARSARK